MRLCRLCETIPFTSLPIFPSDSYHAGLSGKQYIHHCFRARDNPDAPAVAGAAAEAAQRVRYHASLDALREAAAAGCGLCTLVLGEADALLAELDSLGEDERARARYSPPTFDMWLAQRPNGGQGFWVMSEASADRRGGTIMPIAAFAFTVEEDAPFAPFIRGRPVPTTIDVPVLERVRKCIAQCDDVHQDCHQRQSGPVPKRLLDVDIAQSEANGTIKLVELGSEDQQKYAVLSYPSESGITSCLEPDALVDGADIVITSLAKTFQDAILVTRTLGLRYLWIDSLCIPGNLAEWQRSSSHAGAVYSNAYVTISATGAANALDGLFFPRPASRYCEIPYQASDGSESTVLVSRLPLAKELVRSRYMDMKDEPLSAGVWSFQERVLSPRVVHFASDQLYVECARQFVSEDGLRERLRYHTTAEALPAGTKDYRCGAVPRTPAVPRWFDMLWDYARREPADPADKLTALSNVARAFQTMEDGAAGDYIAGHWTGALVESLCWQSLRSKPAGDSAAPSWSWASVDGIVGMGFGNSSSASHHCLATVVGTQIDLQDATNPYGRVTAGAITLQAPPLVPVLLLDDKELMLGARVYRQVRVRSEGGSEKGVLVGIDAKEKRHARPCDVLQEIKLFALVLAESHGDEKCTRETYDPEGTLRGIIVTPAVPFGSGTMRRLGFFVASPADLGPTLLFSTRESVTLV